MKKHLILPGILALGMGLCVFAQSEADYQGWMKDLAATAGKARKASTDKSGADAAAAGQHMEGIYKQVGAFFAKRGGADDAVAIAKKGETAAHDLAAAGAANDADKMAASVQAINGTCGACHMAHRDGQAGAFKIK
jgi:cytochrome c556